MSVHARALCLGRVPLSGTPKNLSPYLIAFLFVRNNNTSRWRCISTVHTFFISCFSTMATLTDNDRPVQPICQNCQTSTTPLWRRDELGSVLCNACGLFLKLHGRPRPISLKTDVIKSRNRVKSSGQAIKKAAKVRLPPIAPCLCSFVVEGSLKWR